MLTDAQLFAQYGPRCSGRSAVVRLNGRGSVTVKPTIVEAVKALNAVLVAFSYSTRAADTGAFNCRRKVGGNGWSIHALKIALDINWTTNPYGPQLVTDFPPGMVRAIKAIRTNSGAAVWSWGGNWSGNKDAMHWQIACSVRDLATGINWATVAGSAQPAPAVPAPVESPEPQPAPVPQPTPPEFADLRKDDLMKLLRDSSGAIWLVYADGRRRHVTDPGHVPWLENFLGVKLFDVGPGSPFGNPLVTLIYHRYFPAA